MSSNIVIGTVLLASSVAIIPGVWVYKKWQETRLRKAIDSVFHNFQKEYEQKKDDEDERTSPSAPFIRKLLEKSSPNKRD